MTIKNAIECTLIFSLALAVPIVYGEGLGLPVHDTFCLDQDTYKKTKEKNKGEFTPRKCQNADFDEESVWFFLSLFVIISWGALVRTILRSFKLSIPYTVCLMMTGLALGFGTRFGAHACDFWSRYTKIARVPPEIILYTFLPPLIFESAFNMHVHIFLKSCTQILVLALPGMLIGIGLTALACKAFMASYGWSYPVAFMYGSIISATDPVAVVAILRELGTSETLGMIIEGESLLNDGVAIFMYEIFAEVVKEEPDLWLKLIVMIFKIGLGGPIFGYVSGWICVFCLSLIFNDAASEITITIVAAYLTYWVGERLGISGVIAVVVLGLKLSHDSTCISPEVEKLMHHFWEMVGYLANTVLFVMVGIIITETGINQIDLQDWFNLAFLYVLLNIIRFMMLMILMPWISRIGYGLKWRDMVVIVWGGLRGAVGLCLALKVYYDEEFCEINEDKVGPKFLFHTAGIVFMTLVLNGTTTKMLLDGLGLTAVSPGRLQDMANAVRQINGAQARALAMLKHDRFLADASWKVVQTYTEIQDPYKSQRRIAKTVKLDDDDTSVMSLDIETGDDPATANPEPDPFAEDEDNLSDYIVEPTPMEYKIMTEEARLRMLKALKVSFWRQYEQGVLTDQAVQILNGVADTTADKELHMIHSKAFQKYFSVRGFFYWIRTRFIKKLKLNEAAELPPKPFAKWRRSIWWTVTRDWFGGLVILIVILNMIPAVWELCRGILVKEPQSDRERDINKQYDLAFFLTNCAFAFIYTIELILKVIGFGFREYLRSNWNILDAVILFICYIDILVTAIYLHEILPKGANLTSTGFSGFFKAVRLLKISRSLRFFRCILPWLNNYVDNKVNYSLFLGYDIGKGFVAAVDDVLKFLPQMVEHPRVLEKLASSLEIERLETIRHLGLLQKQHPKIAIGVKTRHASRAVLNQMRETLNELKEDGLVDETECGALLSLLEQKMKRLWSTPSSIAPSSPEALLANIIWLLSSSELTNYTYNHATLLNFGEGDTMCAIGDPPNGVYLIVSGMVKVHYIPTVPIVEGQSTFGKIPNTEVYHDLTFRTEQIDYYSTGVVLGELGLLTGQPCACSITCETSVLAYHISQNALQEAMKTFTEKNDSLESRIWRSVGMKLAASLLPVQPEYQAWTLDKIKIHLERSAAPIGTQFENMSFPEFVSDVILLQGQLMDPQSKHIFKGPCLINRNVQRIAPVEKSPVQARILIVANEEIDHDHGEHGEHSSETDVTRRKSAHETLERQRRFSTVIPFGVAKKKTVVQFSKK